MDPNKEKALQAALGQIERQFGKGTDDGHCHKPWEKAVKVLTQIGRHHLNELSLGVTIVYPAVAAHIVLDYHGKCHAKGSEKY